MDDDTHTVRSLARRTAPRFAMLYLVLYYLPFPLGHDPFSAMFVNEVWTELWAIPVGWIAHGMLGVDEVATAPTGSGDRLYDWLRAGLQLALALVGAVAWALAERRTDRDPLRLRLVRVYVRYALASALLLYGFVKVFPSQFSPPESMRLLQSFGDASPMGLLWTFMGASMPYTIFSGAAEVLAGVLLLGRRTAVLGAVTAIGVMANVLALNLCYDVPVKLVAAHMLIAAIWIAAPEGRRLLDVVLGRAVAARVEVPLPPRLQRIARVLAPVYGGLLVLGSAAFGYLAWQQVGAEAPEVVLAPWQGTYDVDVVRADGVEVPARSSQPERWRRAMIDPEGRVIVHQMSGRWNFFEVALADDGMWMLSSPRHPERSAAFVPERTGDDDIVLRGEIDGAAIEMELHAIDTSQMLLMSHEMKLVNEAPYNR